jgi:4-hydroxymandelate oxidase
MPAPDTLARMLNLDDVEARARELMPEVVYNFVAGGAADETTIRWNRERFADLKLKQRVLRDLSGLDPSVTLFGEKMPLPILLAPTAGHRYTHPEGELATACGAGAARGVSEPGAWRASVRGEG